MAIGAGSIGSPSVNSDQHEGLHVHLYHSVPNRFDGLVHTAKELTSLLHSTDLNFEGLDLCVRRGMSTTVQVDVTDEDGPMRERLLSLLIEDVLNGEPTFRQHIPKV